MSCLSSGKTEEGSREHATSADESIAWSQKWDDFGCCYRCMLMPGCHSVFSPEQTYKGTAINVLSMAARQTRSACVILAGPNNNALKEVADKLKAMNDAACKALPDAKLDQNFYEKTGDFAAWDSAFEYKELHKAFCKASTSSIDGDFWAACFALSQGPHLQA